MCEQREQAPKPPSLVDQIRAARGLPPEETEQVIPHGSGVPEPPTLMERIREVRRLSERPA